MHMRIPVTLTVVLSGILQANALVPRSPFSHVLLPRQLEGTVCASQCSVFQNAVNSCTTISCICTRAVANGLQGCVNCAVSAAPTSDVISTAEQLVNTYLGTCSGASVSVPNPNPQPPNTPVTPPKTTPIQTPVQPDPVTPPATTRTPVTTPLATTVVAPPTTTDGLVGPLTTIRPTDLSTTSAQQTVTSLPGFTSGALSLQRSTTVGFLGAVVAVVMFTVV